MRVALSIATVVTAAILACWPLRGETAGSLVVVAHPDTPPLDEHTLQKVYMGKIVEVNGRAITPVNLPKGSVARRAFMQQFLTQDDDKFIAYWTVRRYTGQGIPPREFATAEQQLEFLRATAGAVGYVEDKPELTQGLRTLFRKPLPDISVWLLFLASSDH